MRDCEKSLHSDRPYADAFNLPAAMTVRDGGTVYKGP